MHLITTIILSCLTNSYLLADLSPSTKVDAEVTAVYLPTAANTEAPVKLVLESELSPSCFKLNNPVVRVQFDRNVILIHLDATPSQPNCIPDENRLIEQVNVGRLPKGEYEVRSLKTLKKWGTIQVEKVAKLESYQTAETTKR